MHSSTRSSTRKTVGAGAGRVLITGAGAVTLRGSGIARAWEAVLAGELADAHVADLPGDYAPRVGMPPEARSLDAGSLISLDAALQAVEAAGLGSGAGDARRFGVACGLAFRAPGQAALFVGYGQMIARVLRTRGPVLETAGAEASGATAIAAGSGLIATGEADVVIAGAGQALQEPVTDHLRAQHQVTGGYPRPFDAGSDGFLPAPGAAFVVLEAADHAAERGWAGVVELEGLGHAFAPDVEPLATPGSTEVGGAIQGALASAGIVQSQVDLLVSSADGRAEMDRAQSGGVTRTFGTHAGYVPLTSVTGSLGQTLAASAPLSIVMTVEALRQQRVFPIAGFESAGAGPALGYSLKAAPAGLERAIVTSSGLGGTVAAFALKRSS